MVRLPVHLLAALLRSILINAACQNSLGPIAGGGHSGFHQGRTHHPVPFLKINHGDQIVLYLWPNVDEIIMIVEQGSKNLQISEQEFNRLFDQYYINTQGLKIARDLYREFHIK